MTIICHWKNLYHMGLPQGSVYGFPEVSFVQKHETMPIKFVMDKAVDSFNIITIICQ